jgi:hypothetical protein
MAGRNACPTKSKSYPKDEICWVLRGRAGLGVAFSTAVNSTDEPLPNPPPEYRRRGQERAAAHMRLASQPTAPASSIQEFHAQLPITIYKRNRPLLLNVLLSLLPKESGQAAGAAALAGAAAGGVLWFAGARFSRYLLTLAAVALGTLLGLGLPRWFGWKIEPMATGIGGAIALGASAYMLHRMWVGFALGGLLAVWAAVGTWLVLAADQSLSWASPRGVLLPAYLGQLWDALPGDVTRALPIVCAAAFLIGAIPAIVWPRAGRVFLFSALGATLLVAFGVMFTSLAQPNWLGQVPPKTSVQLTALLLAVLIGAGLQWQLYFRKRATTAAGNAEG